MTQPPQPATKIVCWESKYIGNKRILRREVKHIESIDAFILEKIKYVSFCDVDCLVSYGSEQIRIPEKEFDKLLPEVKAALRSESLSPDSWMSRDDRWIKENYWANCKAYIFNFKTYEIKIGIHWGYDGIEGADESYEFLEFEHPFIGEFISCYEKRWGETGEVENIIKYQISEQVDVELVSYPTTESHAEPGVTRKVSIKKDKDNG